MALVAYPTTDYNSYISVADADTYFGTRLNVTEWTGETADNKAIALQQAFRTINGLNLTITFDSDDEIYDDDDGYKLDALEEAQCEQSLWELKHNIDDPDFKSISVGGDLKLDFKDTARPSRIAPRALEALRDYLRAAVKTRVR